MEIHAISHLSTVNSLDKIQALNALGVFTVRDMAEYAPCRHANLLIAFFNQHKLEEASAENYLHASALREEAIAQLAELPTSALKSLNAPGADRLQKIFGVETLQQLSEFPPYKEAQRLIVESIRGEFYEKPSAPSELVPKLIGTTHTQVRYSNYVRDREYLLDDYALTEYFDIDEPRPNAELLNIFKRARVRFFLGYLASIQQKWTIMGTHLGETIYSLALAPGESRNIAVIDWFQRQRSSRREDTDTTERLRAEFMQTRALNEVVQTTANEHLYGKTAVDASTKTTGAGLVAGLGGAKAQGGSVSADLTAILGIPVQAAAGVLESVAGSIGGSLVHSNGTVQGTLVSETTGSRDVGGELVQNISDATVQNAVNVRSVMSTVVVEDEQAGRQRAQTRNVTNYNHSHALSVLYYEILHSYNVRTGADSLSPVLFLPFGPIDFNISVIQEYWYVLREAVRKAMPRRFFEIDQAVKDFDPDNKAFDASGDLSIERVTITRSRSFSEDIRVELDEANPKITLAISGFDMDDCLTFKMSGASTYIEYDVLEVAELDKSTFGTGTVSSFEIEEGVKAYLKSTFYAELKKVMKVYLDDRDKVPRAPAGTKQENLEDNEIGIHSKPDNLIDDVDNDRFKILNKDETLDLTLDIEYTVADQNGEQQIIKQTITKSYTYGTLENEIDEEIGDVTTYVMSYLTTVSDFNPMDVIEDVEQHFRFHKYGYTKYLLATLEKEQIVDIIEHLGIASDADALALTSLIDPNPIALTENQLVFKLKEDKAKRDTRLAKMFSGKVEGTLFGKGSRPMTGSGNLRPIMRDGKKAQRYEFSGQSPYDPAAGSWERMALVLYVFDTANKAGERAVEGKLDWIVQHGRIDHIYPITFKGSLHEHNANRLEISYELENHTPGGLPVQPAGNLELTLSFPEAPPQSLSDQVNEYVNGLHEYEAALRNRHKVETVFLPSSGVFAEAILGLSNASEYVNPRRYYNWQDSPIPNQAPEIQAVDPNRNHAQPVSGALSPTVPVSVLNQISPIQYPMPTSLDSALQAIQNGQMFNDMSKTTEFAGILGNLANLASTTAQLSGNLAGTAGANALAAAVDLGKVVAGMLNTPTSLAGKLEELDSIIQKGNGEVIPPAEEVKLPPMGVPVPSGDKPCLDNGGGPGPNPEPNPTPDPDPDPESNPTPDPQTGTGTPTATTYSQVEVHITSVEVKGGTQLSANLITIINAALALLPIGGDLPTWMGPEFAEAIRPHSTLEVNGTLALKSANGLFVEQRSFTIKAPDTLAFLKNDLGYPIAPFNPYTVDLTSPIKSLAELNGKYTITAFANVDPVSVIDLVINSLISPVLGAALFGMDEVNVGGWTFTGAQILAMLTSEIFGDTNPVSQNVEYFTNLRTYYTQRDLALYIYDMSKRTDFIPPMNPVNDFIVAIPLSSPTLILR